eukprot:5063028-Amphidinium_carterae.1
MESQVHDLKYSLWRKNHSKQAPTSVKEAEPAAETPQAGAHAKQRYIIVQANALGPEAAVDIAGLFVACG